MSDFIECDKLKGRMRDICRGEVDLPLNGPNSINSYRTNLFKVPRLNQSETVRQYPSPISQVTTSYSSPKITTSQTYKPTRWVGTNLALLLKKFGVEVITGCGGCDAWMNEMNVWGPDKCEGEKLPEIKERLKTKAAELKAKEGNAKIWKMGLKMIVKAQWPSIGALIKKAIKQARRELRQNQIKYSTLNNPTRNLIFHIYPKLRAEWNWHWHIDQIRKSAHLFSGKIIIGISVSPETATVKDVQDYMQGISVDHWIVKTNDATHELTTFKESLALVDTRDPNTITLRGHCKGVTYSQEAIQQYWANILWSTCLDLNSVDQALKSHTVAGPLKCHHQPANRNGWYYAGSFYWFRNREMFQRDWKFSDNTRWWVEHWPGHLCSSEEAACLYHEFVGDSTLDTEYWDKVIKPTFEQWKTSRVL